MEPERILPHRNDSIEHVSLEKIAACLRGYAPKNRGDLPEDGRTPPEAQRHAAVLITLVLRDEGLFVLFTRRADHLRHHGGQVSFPGGMAEADDANATATALREASEEIGLKPENARVLGVLDSYITVTGFKVTPVVAVITAQEWKPDISEVADVFEVPLDHILKPDTLMKHEAVVKDIKREYLAFTWGAFNIWGATAGMLSNFVDVVTTPARARRTKFDSMPRRPPGM